MLHFVLCDDNVQMLDRLEKTLESIFINNNINASVSFKSTSPNEILKFIENNPVEVLILDINLRSSVSGCDIANIVRQKNKNVYIIFLTGHLEYALIAYKYKTFDYIAKPVSSERLEETIFRLVDDIKDSNTKFIKINSNTVIKQDDINYIKKDGMKLVYCTSNCNYEVYSSFAKIQSCLPENFVRCHKSYIINVNNITHFATNDNMVEFDHNSTCSIGAKYRNNFLEVLQNGNFKNNLECTNK